MPDTLTLKIANIIKVGENLSFLSCYIFAFFVDWLFYWNFGGYHRIMTFFQKSEAKVSVDIICAWLDKTSFIS